MNCPYRQPVERPMRPFSAKEIEEFMRYPQQIWHLKWTKYPGRNWKQLVEQMGEAWVASLIRRSRSH